MNRRDVLKAAASCGLLPLVGTIKASPAVTIYRAPLPPGCFRRWRAWCRDDCQQEPAYNAFCDVLDLAGCINAKPWRGFGSGTITAMGFKWPVERDCHRWWMLDLVERSPRWHTADLIDPTTYKVIGHVGPIHTRVDFAHVLDDRWELRADGTFRRRALGK
jgi:hypothetical protein